MAKMLDLVERDGRYYFRWKAERSGGGDDFGETLVALKAKFRALDRTYDPEANHLWSVPASAETEKLLAEVFSNANMSFLGLHSQLRLF